MNYVKRILIIATRTHPLPYNIVIAETVHSMGRESKRAINSIPSFVVAIKRTLKMESVEDTIRVSCRVAFNSSANETLNKCHNFRLTRGASNSPTVDTNTRALIN